MIVYDPAPVPAGSTNTALAAPPVTVPEVTGVPMVVPPCDTVNVTLPALTVPPELTTVAVRVTFWLTVLEVAVASAPVVIVGLVPTVNVWVLSVLLANPPAAL